jgi:hypothetical protein
VRNNTNNNKENQDLLSNKVAILRKRINDIENCDRKFINNPQYLVDYVKEIFADLLQTEVRLNLFTLYNRI